MFFRVPIGFTSTSISSPSCSWHLGFWNQPTPAGVPVMIAVPAGIVVPCDTKLSSSSTAKMKSKWLSWTTRPLTLVVMRPFAFALIRDGCTRRGPSGANLSNPLAYVYCPPQERCKKRAVRSFPMVYPSMLSAASDGAIFFIELRKTIVSSPYIHRHRSDNVSC